MKNRFIPPVKVFNSRQADDEQRVLGVSRDASNTRSLSLSMTQAASDDDLRQLHDYLREWRRR